MANDCKYQRKQYQISYDSGSTWHNAVPARYEKGDLIEYSSIDCSGIEVQYRWRELEGQYICVDNNKYTKEVREESYDNGATWYVSYPTVYKEGYFVEYNEEYCSFKFKGHYYVTDNPSQPINVCPKGYYYNGYQCRNIATGSMWDPLKVVKCNDNSALTQSETTYYISYYDLFSVEIGSCVRTLPDNLFSGKSVISNLTIGNNVETIGDETFYCCSGLTSVTIPDSVISIGNRAFQYCYSLSSLTIGNGVTSIGYSAFNATDFYDGNINRGELRSVIIGDSISYIDAGAFDGQVKLTGITIQATTPPTLNDSRMFDRTGNCPIFVPCGCKDAYKTAPNWSKYANRITTIGCNEPKKIQMSYINGNYWEIDCDTGATIAQSDINSSSYNASGLTSAIIGDCVNKIGAYAFKNCYSLSSITIPNSVTSISDMAFNNCESILSIIIPNGITSIGVGTFQNCYSLSNITIPDSVTSIGYDSFRNCSGITSCIIGSGVTRIDTSAFQYCTSLTSVTIPNSVTGISYYAFNNCESLTSITVEATTPPSLGGNVFDSTNNCPIYVPSGSVNAYKSASGWSSYSSRIQAIP